MLMDGCIGFEDEDLAGDVIGMVSGMRTSLMIANTVGAAATEGIEGSGGSGGVGAGVGRRRQALASCAGVRRWRQALLSGAVRLMLYPVPLKLALCGSRWRCTAGAVRLRLALYR